MDEEFDYITRLETHELIEIVANIWGFEETSAALMELEEREPFKALELGTEILEKNKGDDYLQATTWDIIMDIDPYQTVNALDRRKEGIGKVLLKDMMNYLSIDYHIKDLNTIPFRLIERIFQTYNSLDESEKEEIYEDYNELKNKINRQLIPIKL